MNEARAALADALSLVVDMPVHRFVPRDCSPPALVISFRSARGDEVTFRVLYVTGEPYSEKAADELAAMVAAAIESVPAKVLHVEQKRPGYWRDDYQPLPAVDVTLRHVAAEEET